MRINRSTWLRLLSGAAVIIALIVIRVFPSSMLAGKPKSDPVVRITSFGTHLTPESDWVESISITSEGNKYILYIQERPVVTGRQWWLPFQRANSSYPGLEHTCRPADEFIVAISDEQETVTYEGGNYRWIYDSLDPNGSIGREESISPNNDTKQ